MPCCILAVATALGLRYMAAVGQIAAQSADSPVALHLDHATETEVLQANCARFHIRDV